MEKEEALQFAFDTLDDLQFTDNTWQEAVKVKLEVKEILRQLADHLTQRAPDVLNAGEFSATWVINPDNIVPPAISG